MRNLPSNPLRVSNGATAGWLWFSEVTDIWTIAGAVVILASTYALARSETRKP